MVIKETWLNLADNSSIKWLRVFHLYGGFFRKKTSPGYYIKGSIKVLKYQRIFYKGFRQKLFKKGGIKRLFLIRSTRTLISKTSLNVSFKQNVGSVIKKKNVFVSKHSLGPSILLLKNKRMLASFIVST